MTSTTSSTASRAYKRIRRNTPYLTASAAWFMAKRESETLDESDVPADVTVTVTTEPDDSGPRGRFDDSEGIDRARLGFSEDWSRSFRYWTPESDLTIESLTDDLKKFNKLPLTVAREWAIDSLRRECDADVNGYVAVIVTVTDEFGTKGTGVICGIEFEDNFDAVANEYDLLTEALADLSDARDRVVATADSYRAAAR
jgi:hypothetical protein